MKKFTPSLLFLFLPGVVLLIFYFWVKVLHFQRCDYTSDIFCHLQISRDWLLGKPLFYENCYGYHGKIHNYFFDLLMAPFTYFFNAYGLFIVLFGLVIYCFYLALRYFHRMGASFQAQLLFTIIFVCPLTYYILHDETYGFHAELLLFPFALIFSITHISGNKLSWLWAVLLVLIKEDAVLLLWCCLGGIYLFQWSQQKFTSKILFKKILISFFVCLVIFIAGILWIKYQNDWGHTRSGALYRTLKEQTIYNLSNSFAYLVSQRIQLTFFLILIIYLFAGLRFTLGSIIFSIPILIFNLSAGIIYFDAGEFMTRNLFSVLWAPRLAMYWGYWLSILFLALLHQPKVIIQPKLIRTLACIGYGIILFKFQFFFFIHSYLTQINIKDDVKNVFRTNIQFEQHPEYADASAIADQLPNNYVVAPIYKVFGAFNKQDIAWRHNWLNSYYPIRMILTSHKTDEIPEVNRILKQPYTMVYKDRLNIYIEAEDTLFISRAGIEGKWEKYTE